MKVGSNMSGTDFNINYEIPAGYDTQAQNFGAVLKHASSNWRDLQDKYKSENWHNLSHADKKVSRI
jgi:hypothetical protein